MCSAVPCKNCGKYTWTGCGLHGKEKNSGAVYDKTQRIDVNSFTSCSVPRLVAEAMTGIPSQDRCSNWVEGLFMPCTTKTNVKQIRELWNATDELKTR